MKEKIKSKIVFALLAILSLHSAFAQVSADYDSKTDFKKFNTYAWIAPGDSVLNRIRPDKLYAGYIMYAANLELKKRGMKIDTLRPDAIFMFDTSLQGKVKYSESPSLSVGLAVAAPGYYVGGSVPVAGGKITETQYHEGTLQYGMYDTRTGGMIWRGWTSKNFDNSADVEELIAEATKKIFKKLPKKAN